MTLCDQDTVVPRFNAFEVTLTGVEGGEYLPLLPACGGGLSPPARPWWVPQFFRKFRS